MDHCPAFWAVTRLNALLFVLQGNLTVAVTRLTALLNIREVGERVFSDLSETWWMIGISLVGACILSFTWILLMRFLAGTCSLIPASHPH